MDAAGGLDMRKKNLLFGMGILTAYAVLGLGGCQSENPKILEKSVQKKLAKQKVGR